LIGVFARAVAALAVWAFDAIIGEKLPLAKLGQNRCGAISRRTTSI
jgi:hypothetical protein